MTTSQKLNSLASASSSYLRSAMHQPIEWHEWGEEAFALAVEKNRPILLDIGAVWCHWCHVMDRESYEDPEIAEILNSKFVAVKVDRDERPDVDARYQAAVSAISGQGGWPLTAVLTPAGRPFFGGTYFPKDERYGRPGFATVLKKMAEAYATRHDEVLESAKSVVEAIEYNESFAGRSGDLHEGLIEKLVQSALQQFDERNGGFGSQPKFPHPSALDLLIDTAARTGDEKARTAVTVTLNKMASGGIYDHLAGGFHRYSVDERWVVPHFEKMAYDNSELLKTYVHAFQTFVDPHYAAVAHDILRWMDEWLTDRERGGFYGSQDADYSLEDDGDYFTWTRKEAAAVLTPEELGVAGPWWDIGELGDMHHNPEKNVLHVKYAVDEIAKRAGLTVEEVRVILDRAKEKLYAARLLRPAPYVDKTIYVNWNALCISAYLEAARVLAIAGPREFALKTLDRVLAEGWSVDTGLVHAIAYSDGPAGPRRVAGMLDDYAMLTHACVDAWESTGELKYYEAAVEIADAMIARFHDPVGGGFFDTETVPEGTTVLGALTARRKPLQDSPTPAGNPMAAAALLRLEALNGSSSYRDKAQDTLEAFGGVVEHFGLYAGTYGLALRRWLSAPVQVVVVGEADEAAVRTLSAVAMARYAVNKSVVRLSREQIMGGDLPPALKESLPHLPELSGEGSFAVVCSDGTCFPAVTDAAELVALLTQEL